MPRFLIDFLPKRKHLSISWLQSPSAVIVEFKKIKSVTASTFSAFYLPSTDGTKCHDLSFLNAEFQANFFTFLFHLYQATFLGFPGSSAGKESACSAGDLVQSLGWKDLVETGMAAHASVLAWRIPRTEEPDGLQFIGSQRVRHD